MTESPSRTAPFAGELIDPAHPSYASRRGIVDGRHAHRPALVARCLHVDDVVAALELARGRGLPVAVRAGGHGFHGHGTVQDGLMIDLSDLRGVTVDPQRRVARIQPGALSGDVLNATLPHGLAPVAGERARVGYTGQTIFNGQGYLGPRYGNACDNVLALEVVLADGEVVRATEHENPNLFWALRGAGDSFGIVVAIEVALYPAPQTVHTGELHWEPEHVRSALLRLEELDAQLSDGILWSVYPAPPGEPGPSIVLDYIHLGTEDELERDLEVLRTAGPLIDEHRTAMSYLELHHRPGFTGARSYVAGAQLARLDESTVDTLLALPPTGDYQRAIFVYPLRGALAQEPAVPNAYSIRSGITLSVRVSYDDPAQDEGHAAWAESTVDAFVAAGLTLYGANGTAVNHVSRIDHDVLARVYGDRLPRLLELKRYYDPLNVFGRSVLGLLVG